MAAMITVEIEITGVILRLRNKPGVAFQMVLPVVGDEGTATVKGAINPIPGFRVPVCDALRSLGFKRIRWSRHLADGTPAWAEFPL